VYAIFLGFFICTQSFVASGKDAKESGKAVNSASPVAANNASVEFQWNEHNKLSWEDFRGDVRAETERSAAATHCGIGFKTKTEGPDKKPKVVVYNTFYTSKSWVRPDAKMPEILEHEQGHFDLCEIYTRKLRARMDLFDFGVTDIRTALMNIYDEVSREYERRQQAYEQETVHGTNITAQKHWREMIALEL
jgi:hypothetical protein